MKDEREKKLETYYISERTLERFPQLKEVGYKHGDFITLEVVVKERGVAKKDIKTNWSMFIPHKEL